MNEKVSGLRLTYFGFFPFTSSFYLLLYIIDFSSISSDTFTLYWIAPTPRRKPQRIGIQMKIIAEVNENERELKTTEGHK